jgi:uncharacterized repeat protein (TIGR03803 family)
MNTRRIIRLVGVLAAMLFTIARAQTYSVLRQFSGSDGQGPVGPLVLSGNSLYGTTYLGGNSNYGTIFTLRTDGASHSVLKHFEGPLHSHGAIPSGNLIFLGNALFGTAEAGGAYGIGTVFRIGTNGSGYTVLYSFGSSDTYSARPRAGLVAIGNTLFGTTYGKQTPVGYGTVFRVSTNGGSFSAPIRFDPQTYPGDGKNPHTGLAASGTNLFGTTYAGGTSGYGTIFRMGTNGPFSYIKHFAGSDGANPRTPLLISGSALFGATMYGGSSALGTLFKLNTNGTGFTVLKHFAGGDGALPLGSLMLAGNYLYGTTYSGGSSDLGTIFRIHTNGSGFAVIKEFGGPDGANPGGGLVRSGAVVYGTAYAGGGSGNGLVFSLNLSPVVTARNLDNLVELSWPSSAGLEYQVQVKTQLNQAAWTELGSSITVGGTTATATDSVEPGQQRFYRVVLLE